VLGIGCFGIVYLVQDHSLERQVLQARAASTGIEPAPGATPQPAPVAAWTAPRAKPLTRPSTARSRDRTAADRDPAQPTDAVTLPPPACLTNGRRELTRQTTSVAPAPAAGPATASAACGSRRGVCMDRECEQPPYRDSAEFIPVLNTKRQRAEH